MSRHKELGDFEKRFPDDVTLEELRHWRDFFLHRASHLQPKVAKLAMKSVHRIEKAINDKEAEQQ